MIRLLQAASVLPGNSPNKAGTGTVLELARHDPSSSSSTLLLLLHLLADLCRHPCHHSQYHHFYRPGCLPVLSLLPLLLRLLLHSLVFGLPSSVLSSLGSSRSCISFRTRQLSRSLSSHPHSLRCFVRPLITSLSQTRLPSRLPLRRTPWSSSPS